MSGAKARHGIYYWKCDRASAFHGTAQGVARERPELDAQVRELVERYIGRPLSGLRDGGGQGNHLTFVARVGEREFFVRLEDGPEQDDYIAVESWVMNQVRTYGVPTPQVHASDASRREFQFAWQILDRVGQPDLNRHFKAGTLDQRGIARQLGQFIARWQMVPVEGFGPFRVDLAINGGRLGGWHATYPDYHFTRLDEHLRFLYDRAFLDGAQVARIERTFAEHRALLDLPGGCLVHKDLALWNVLGSEREISAIIDWDDCIAGDPMDDLSLLACFHDGAFLRAAFEGFESVRTLPHEHVRRFWVHLLRNMLFKAVIRVGAGYFHHGSAFFLVGANGSGATLREHTLRRIDQALRGLEEAREPFSL